MSDNKFYWFNYKTGDYELIDTPSDFTNYIPQQDAAISLYKLYIQTGDPALEAARKVLSICVGEKP